MNREWTLINSYKMAALMTMMARRIVGFPHHLSLRGFMPASAALKEVDIEETLEHAVCGAHEPVNNKEAWIVDITKEKFNSKVSFFRH
jgi:hypothetical protein